MRWRDDCVQNSMTVLPSRSQKLNAMGNCSSHPGPQDLEPIAQATRSDQRFKRAPIRKPVQKRKHKVSKKKKKFEDTNAGVDTVQNEQWGILLPDDEVVRGENGNTFAKEFAQASCFKSDTMYFLIGNEHVQTSEHRHSVKLFVRGVGQHGLDDVLLVRFGFHSTLARPESVVFKEPFECKLGLWGFFNVPISIEFKSGRDPVVVEHMISFEQPRTQRVLEVAKVKAPRPAEEQRLLAAVKFGDASGVRRSIAELGSGSRAEQVCREGMIMALIQHSEEVLGAFFGDSSSFSKLRQDGDAALWKAIMYYAQCARRQGTDMSTVAKKCVVHLRKAIVDMGASALVRDAQGRLPCHVAAREGSLDLLKELHKHAGVSTTRDGNGYNILHHAAEIGRADVLAWLLTLPEIENESMLNEVSAGSFGPGLTPFLLGTVATSSYYKARLDDLLAIFGRYQVPWSAVEKALSLERLEERLKALRDACATLDGGGKAHQDDANKQELQGLYFYNYIAGQIAEGHGVVSWQSTRAQLIFERLASPLFDVLESGKATASQRLFLKKMRPIARASVSLTNGQSLTAALVARSNQVTNVLRVRLDETQLNLRNIPTATLPGKQLHKLPIGWDKVHLQHCHRNFKWLFPTNTSDWSDVKLIFEALSSVGLCSSAATFIDFVDNVVLPKIDFESLDDERPAIDDGTTSVAKFTPPVMRLVSAKLKLCAYEAILVEMAARADPAFQAHFKTFIDDLDTNAKVKSGPVKLLERVSEKKFDYMFRPPFIREGRAREGKHHAETIVLCAGLVECADNSYSTKIRGNPAAAGNICDISRLSVEIGTEDEMVEILEKLLGCTLEREGFQVVRYSNGHHRDSKSPSGYRDVKLLVLSNIGSVDSREKTVKSELEDGKMFIHEVQLLLSLWLAAKKNMHVAYGFVRSAEKFEIERRASAEAAAARQRSSAAPGAAEDGFSLLTSIAREAAQTRWLNDQESALLFKKQQAEAKNTMSNMFEVD